MPDLEVRIEELEPMLVASVRVVSESPELDAWEKMSSWAGAKGLLGNTAEHPVYGFNNPSPSPGRKEYGYEFWIKVPDDIESEGEIEIKVDGKMSVKELDEIRKKIQDLAMTKYPDIERLTVTAIPT